MTAAPTWLDGAYQYEAKVGRIAHHDGTCDSMYPGTWRDRDGRCVLPEGHEGPHVYRHEGREPPTREQAYQAEREQKKRDRLRRERVARAECTAGYPG
jgi:hypothetical protein